MIKYKLGDVVKVISERVDNPANCEYEKFVGLEHYVSGEVEIKKYGDTNLLKSAMKVFNSGDILVARRNVYLKRASIVWFDGITSGDSIVLRVENELLRKIIPFILNTEEFWEYAEKFSDGTMSKRLSLKVLLEYEFMLPQIDKQEELSEILWAVNNTKDAYKKLIYLTDELVKSQFIEMFENDECERKCLDELSVEWFKGQAFRKRDLSAEGLNKCIHYGELFTKYGPVINNVISKTDVDVKRVSKKGDILFPASDVTPNGLARCSTLMLEDVLLGGDIIVMRPLDDIFNIFKLCN